jgi:hypothetical protein
MTTVRDEMDVLRRENAAMRKVLSNIADMRGQEQWDERNFGSFAIALAAQAQTMLDNLARAETTPLECSREGAAHPAPSGMQSASQQKGKTYGNHD